MPERGDGSPSSMVSSMAWSGRLGNQAFTARAKPEVVAEARRRLDEARREQSALRTQEERS